MPKKIDFLAYIPSVTLFLINSLFSGCLKKSEPLQNSEKLALEQRTGLAADHLVLPQSEVFPEALSSHVSLIEKIDPANYGQPFCSGIALTRTWVLTTATCLKSYMGGGKPKTRDISDFAVSFTRKKDDGKGQFFAKKIVFHESDEIALMELTENLPNFPKFSRTHFISPTIPKSVSLVSVVSWSIDKLENVMVPVNLGGFQVRAEVVSGSMLNLGWEKVPHCTAGSGVWLSQKNQDNLLALVLSAGRDLSLSCLLPANRALLLTPFLGWIQRVTNEVNRLKNLTTSTNDSDMSEMELRRPVKIESSGINKVTLDIESGPVSDVPRDAAGHLLPNPNGCLEERWGYPDKKCPPPEIKMKSINK